MPDPRQHQVAWGQSYCGWWFLSPAYCPSLKQHHDAACLKSKRLQETRPHPLSLQQEGVNLSQSSGSAERRLPRGRGRQSLGNWAGKRRRPPCRRLGAGDFLAPGDSSCSTCRSASTEGDRRPGTRVPRSPCACPAWAVQQYEEAAATHSSGQVPAAGPTRRLGRFAACRGLGSGT